MGKFRLRKAVAAADLATLEITVSAVLPYGPPLYVEYTTEAGKRISARGGLPDVLEGETGAARQIWTGSAVHGSTNHAQWMDGPPVDDLEPCPVVYIGGQFQTNPEWHAWMIAHNPEYAAEQAALAYKAASEGE